MEGCETEGLKSRKSDHEEMRSGGELIFDSQSRLAWSWGVVRMCINNSPTLQVASLLAEFQSSGFAENPGQRAVSANWVATSTVYGRLIGCTPSECTRVSPEVPRPLEDLRDYIIDSKETKEVRAAS